MSVLSANVLSPQPEPTIRPEDVEKTRTPTGTQKQVGSAIYTLSSYLNHSCTPNAQPTFPSGTTELHIVAAKDLKKGDELNIAYVDIERHEGESVADARRRRRVELARGWRFACPCEKCEQEGKELSVEEQGEEGKDGVENGKDESKIEESARRFEEYQKESSTADMSADIE